jgi:hypothetical protein
MNYFSIILFDVAYFSVCDKSFFGFFFKEGIGFPNDQDRKKDIDKEDNDNIQECIENDSMLWIMGYFHKADIEC